MRWFLPPMLLLSSSAFVHQPSLPSFLPPSGISSPVLQRVYSALLEHNQTYGHPNIPLGTSEGRDCDVLRRLAIQGKLPQADIELLQSLQFRFHSLEDVYDYADFEDLFQRLLQYEAVYQTNYQVPKKFAPDPELGAWVTGLRRLGPTNVAQEHAKRLTDVGFSWISARQCGSAFMTQYRTLLEQTKEDPTILIQPETVAWKRAQRVARAKGTLSDTRYHYMEVLFGAGWDVDE